MNNVFKRDLESLDEGSRELLERMMDYMERRCISIPMQAAKSLAKKENSTKENSKIQVK